MTHIESNTGYPESQQDTRPMLDDDALRLASTLSGLDVNFGDFYENTLTHDQLRADFAERHGLSEEDVENLDRVAQKVIYERDLGDFYDKYGVPQAKEKAHETITTPPFDFDDHNFPGEFEVRSPLHNLKPQPIEIIDWSKFTKNAYSKVKELGGLKLAATALAVATPVIALGMNSDTNNSEIADAVRSNGPGVEMIDGVVVGNSVLLEERYPELPVLQAAVDNVLMNYRHIGESSNSEDPVLAERNLAIDDDRIVLAYGLVRAETASDVEVNAFGLTVEQVESIAPEISGFDLESYDPEDLEQSATAAVAYLDRELRGFYRQSIESGEYRVEDLTNPRFKADILHDFAQRLHPEARGFAEYFTQTVINWSSELSPPLNDGQLQSRQQVHQTPNTETSTNRESRTEGLSELMPEMQQYAQEIIDVAASRGLELIVPDTGGDRTNQEQALLYAQGRSQEEINEGADELISLYGREDLAEIMRSTPPQPGGVVTWKLPGEGKHNYGAAVDIVPVVNGSVPWDDTSHPAWAQYGQIISEVGGVELRWGQSFGDWPHVELTNFDWEYAILHPEEFPESGERIRLSKQQFDQILVQIAEANDGSFLPLIPSDLWNDQDWAQFSEFAEATATQEARIVRDQALAEQNQAQETFEQSTNERMNDFINTYGQYAINVGREYGIPPEVILAQAAHESGYGDSRLNQEANNFFGIKTGDSWNGPVYNADTIEEINGQDVLVPGEPFRRYPNPEEGFRGYAEAIINSGYYADAIEAYARTGDPKEYLRRLVDGNGPNYATDSAYFDLVSSLIDDIHISPSSGN